LLDGKGKKGSSIRQEEEGDHHAAETKKKTITPLAEGGGEGKRIKTERKKKRGQPLNHNCMSSIKWAFLEKEKGVSGKEIGNQHFEGCPFIS